MKLINKFSNFYMHLAILLMLASFAACTPDDNEFTLGPTPTSEMVQFSTTPSTGNPNIIEFKNETPGTIKAIWDFGNGSTGEGNQVSNPYPVQGNYTVKLTVFTKDGYTSNTKTVSIASTDVTMLNREDYNFLTGGASNTTGKTWVIDKDFVGHMGVGPIASATPDWWQAPANDKAGQGLYNDEMTFNLNGFAYTYDNKGDTFVNGGNAAGLGGTNQTDDYTLNHTPPANMVWSMVEEGGKKYLVISQRGFIAYYTGSSRYEVLKLTENELYLKTTDAANAANGWWLRLIPKGYTRPVEPKPYKIVDIQDNFDTEGTVVWKKDALTLNESYDNPAPFPINNSAKVAMYAKQEGQAYAFANMFADFDHKLDITNRNIFKIKVFIPGYNDFTTENGESWAIKTLLRQVSIKLQDGSAPEPWVNQVEVKQAVNVLDKWVELTFDFSPYAERKDLDRVVIQVGGEGNYIPGVFFLDDFRLEK
ncbi:PKD domain-containing protein [Pontibacter sp. SGAir0037]|uniref:PKD domain-containing protein n=1 Tax=Pontibacter sp. SGAir0037 TaxID=2571030 RepID=UPI0010CCB7C7|nr:PKD domain-containing protein [Pontibacter sp. SGAir0037]QCR23297.1 hypothetical protein C1N53_13750 [Pontibacter sp. SGAir0037]